MSENQETRFVFVPGLGHGSWFFSGVQQRLEELGYETHAIDLPIEDPSATSEDFSRILMNEAEIDEKSILVGHSRGGKVITRAACEAKAKRLVYVCSALEIADIAEIETAHVSDMPERLRPDYRRVVERRRDEHDRVCLSSRQAEYYLYNDCSKDVQAWAAGLLKPQRRPKTETPIPVWPKTPAIAIYGWKDRVLNPQYVEEFSERMLGRKAIGRPWDHSPFLSRPEELVKDLSEIAGGLIPGVA